MQLYFTGGNQTTDAAFTPGMLAQLHAVIWAQTWYLRVMDGGAPLIRALAFRRQPMRPGALPFLRRALVLLASLAMLPCTKAADVWWTTGTGCTGANEHDTFSGKTLSQCAALCVGIAGNGCISFEFRTASGTTDNCQLSSS